MNRKTLAVVALDNRVFSSLEEKLKEAVGWMEIAARQGAELIVLPEGLNFHRGDGEQAAREETPEKVAFADWRSETRILIEAAERWNLWVTIPVLHRSEGKIYNSFFLVSPEGKAVWRYDKVSLTPEELSLGVTPGRASTYNWKGIKLGGAICFDTCFPENLEEQVLDGVQLFLVPSLWPGGSQLNHICKLRGARIALAYPAWSRIIDIDGREIVQGGYRQETLRFGFGIPVFTASLNFDRVSLYGNHNQERMREVAMKYGSRVGITFDQENCLWFLESKDETLSEADILKEFGLTPAGEYFADCTRRLSGLRQ